jgi:uncharacterized protein (TIGR02145 family)
MARFNISDLTYRSGIFQRSNFTILLSFLCGILLLNSCIKDPTIPIIITNPGTEITINSAKISGEITDDGGSPVTARGICWGTGTNPSIEGSHATDGAGSGSFLTTITELNPNTIYHARAYAENSVGIAYGNEIIFTTSTAAPVLKTIVISEVTDHTAMSGGKITYDGGAGIIAKGICWSTSPEPDIYDFFTCNGTDTSSYKSKMTGLVSGTRYYIRAFAQNKAGIAYGEQLVFNTKIADVEGNLYSTVTIGSQVWMAENLKSTKYNNNTPIPNVPDNTAWINLTTPGYCWFANDIKYKDTYGALYNWFTVNTGILCPAGWHVPTDAEYKTLELYLGLPSDQLDGWEWRGTDQGTQMKTTTGWDNGGNGTNSSGFSAVAGGYRYGATGAFNANGILTYWWTADYSADYGWYRRLDGAYNGIYRAFTSKKGGKYVRCVKN